MSLENPQAIFQVFGMTLVENRENEMFSCLTLRFHWTFTLRLSTLGQLMVKFTFQMS